MNERELNVICDRCMRNIADGCGDIWISLTQVHQCELDALRWTANQQEKVKPGGLPVYSVEDLRSFPEAVRWNAHHSACDPSLAGDAYNIEVHRMRSWADLVRWTAHLLEKAWLSATDWSEVLEGAAQRDGRRISPVTPAELNF